MARRPRAPQIETRTSRLKLAVRRKPYAFTVISPGIALGYRRNNAAGVWVVRVADGKGGNWTKRVGLADDHEAADGEHVLTFWEAQDKARKLARGSDADSGRPANVADAVEAYARDLAARGGDRENAGRIRKHLTPTLASKPVGLLTARELAAWRDRLLADGVKSATVVRLMKSTKAALNLSARRDPRIQNTAAWRDGLGGIAENFASRNVQRLDDDQVRAVVAAAYEVDPAFGMYTAVATETGARLSQIARLTVADLQDADNGSPRLMMPTSRKGRARKASKRPVPITHELAAKLASNRAPGAPLLLRADGLPWQSGNDGDHSRLYAEAAARAGVTGTIYALRHSSIVRSILAGVPLRVIAACCDTSTTMLERVYSAYIADFADEIARRGLLVPTARPATKRVVPLAGRRP
jgi:integrase